MTAGTFLMWQVFFYLNNVTSGGQTNFPRAATAQHPHGGPQARRDHSSHIVSRRG